MTDSRTRTLDAIRSSLGRGPLTAEAAQACDDRLARPRQNVVPARGRTDPDTRLATFVAEAERVNATTDRVESMNAVPAAISGYLAGANLPAVVRIAPDPALAAIPWQTSPTLTVTSGVASDGDLVAVTGAFAGIAETGTVILASGPESPTTLNFLPDTHIVVIAADRVLGAYEDAWAALRADRGPAMPRTVNWITGPSRTADIEQTLLLGAHGPRRLHIVIVDDDGAP